MLATPDAGVLARIDEEGDLHESWCLRSISGTLLTLANGDVPRSNSFGRHAVAARHDQPCARTVAARRR